MKKKTKIIINIWDFIDMEDINNILDEKIKYKFLATEIDYTINKIINKKGKIELIVKYL